MDKNTTSTGVSNEITGRAGASEGVDLDLNLKSDMLTAYRILVNEGILDGFGHITVRSTKDPAIFLMPRAMPPALVELEDILALNIYDSQPIDPRGRKVNGERYLHGEIYKRRPDVMAIVHTHSPGVIPLTLANQPLRPVLVQAGFLPPETPNFEIRDVREPDGRGMQITDSKRGAALASALGPHPVALLRGHGNVVVGSTIKQATVYAIYVEINARAQMQGMILSGSVNALDDAELFSPEEFDINRPWEHYRLRVPARSTTEGIDRSQFGLGHTQDRR